jgi:signal transduction histidine kinase
MKSGNYKEAKIYYEKAIKFSNKKEDTQSYLYKIIDFGEYHLLTKDTAKANALFNEALQLSKELKSGNEELKTLNFLAITNPKKTTYYKNEYVRISDSIVKKQRASRDKFARIEFETSQVEDQNKVLSYKNLVLVLGIIISVFIFILIIYIKHKISLKKELQLLEQKNIADRELFKLTSEFQIELVNAKQNAQNRISKELHDGIMNQIYGVRLNLGFLNEFDDKEAKEKRLILVKELQKIETEIRSLSHDLSSENNFNNSDFTFLLHNLIKSNNNISTTEFTIDVDEIIDWSTYSSLIKINVYRILQELFLNVNKYANAKKCALKMTVEKADLCVSVTDDGIGFEVSKISDGIGLKNIKERVEIVKGTLTVLSKIDKGAQFNISIPIE